MNKPSHGLNTGAIIKLQGILDTLYKVRRKVKYRWVLPIGHWRVHGLGVDSRSRSLQNVPVIIFVNGTSSHVRIQELFLGLSYALPNPIQSNLIF